MEIIIVFLSIVLLLLCEVKFLESQNINKSLYKFYLMTSILLPFWEQNLISIIPFFVLIFTNIIRIWKPKSILLFNFITVTNILILYFQFGFLIKNYLIFGFQN